MLYPFPLHGHALSWYCIDQQECLKYVGFSSTWTTVRHVSEAAHTIRFVHRVFFFLTRLLLRRNWQEERLEECLSTKMLIWVTPAVCREGKAMIAECKWWNRPTRRGARVEVWTSSTLCWVAGDALGEIWRALNHMSTNVAACINWARWVHG